jgi:autotransporter family porin
VRIRRGAVAVILVIVAGVGCGSDRKLSSVAPNDTSTAVAPAGTRATSSTATATPSSETAPAETSSTALPTTGEEGTAAAPVVESHFGTLPVGAALPSDAECAARVRPTAEIRPANAKYNSVRGAGPAQTGTFYGRVSGNFTGTTDEIIQWAACKWGIDEDIVRAQTAKESGWFQQNRGDYTDDPTHCVPGHGIGVDGKSGQCPESIGLMQVRYQYLTPAFPMATDSSAYNLDEALAARRSCFEGNEPWLNTVDRGSDYVAGDLWGCIGMWFAGRWHTSAADEYAAAVRDYLDQQVWATPEFLTWTPG